MKSSVGLTFIELLIAIVVLAVGVLMAAAMQTTALRASGDATAIQGVTRLAETEIERLRQIDLAALSGTSEGCETELSEEEEEVYTCQLEVRPCQLSGTDLSCTEGSSSNAVADQAIVTVNGPREKTITLRTVKAR